MATKKVVAKIAAKKPAPKKATATSVKKVAPAKKAVAAKKTVAPVKKAAIPAKKAVAPTKKVVVSKKAIPAKKVAVKVVAKAVSKTPAKVIKPVSKATKSAVKPAAESKFHKQAASKPMAKSVAPQKTNKPLTKKIEVKKPATKPTAVKAAVKASAVKEKVAAVVTTPKVVTPKAPVKVAVAKPVILPKINTKTSRKYEPDFTKSVLDKAPVDPGAPMVMYGDADLAEFKELIQRKLGSAKKELVYLQGLITRKDDMGGDEGDGRYMTMEDGSLSMEREQLSQMASRQITFVDHLEKALIRIENKTYGVCRITGKLIDKARLRAVPHATLSIEAKMSGGK